MHAGATVLLLLLLLATMTYNQVQSFRINYLADQSSSHLSWLYSYPDYRLYTSNQLIPMDLPSLA